MKSLGIPLATLGLYLSAVGCTRLSLSLTHPYWSNKVASVFVNVSAANLSVSPSSPAAVVPGSTQSFVVTPASGYSTLSTVGGSCPPGSWSGNTYVTGTINADCTLSFSSTPSPGSFSINGATDPPTDTTADAFLMDGNTVTATWGAASGADSYDVTIYQSDGSTIQCATQNVSAPSTSYTFSGCSLSYGTSYDIAVVAKTSLGGTTSATNNLFSFYVQHTPTANADTYFVQENGSAATLNVLTNDSDNGDGNTLTISSINTTGTSGSVVNNGSTVSYTPSSNFTGVDQFSYTLWDGHNGYATATVSVNVMGAYTWTGALGNNIWDNTTANAGNWCGTVKADNSGCSGATTAPTTTSTVIFDNTCGTFCSPNIDASVSVAGLEMNSGYTGTITQTSTYTLTVGSTGWNLSAGTFDGGTGNITINGNVNETGGDFSASSGGVTVSGTNTFTMSAGTFSGGSSAITFYNFNLAGGSFTASSNTISISQGGSWTVSGTPTFNANGGTFAFNFGTCCTTSYFTPGNLSYNNLSTINTSGTDINVLTVNGTANIGGNLVFGGRTNLNYINSGTLKVAGNVTAQNGGAAGSGLIEVVGNSLGPVTITGVSTSLFPSLTINAGSNNVILSGSIIFAQGMTYTYTSAGSLTTTGTTIGANFTNCCSVTKINPGTATYNNFVADITGGAANDTVDILSSFNLGGTFTIGPGNDATNVLNVDMPNPGTAYTLSVAGAATVNLYTILNLYGATFTYGSLTNSGTINP